MATCTWYPEPATTIVIEAPAGPYPEGPEYALDACDECAGVDAVGGEQ